MYDARYYQLFDGAKVIDQGEYLFQGTTLTSIVAGGNRMVDPIQMIGNSFRVGNPNQNPATFQLIVQPPRYGPGPVGAAPTNLSGVWLGGYTCGQGPTALRLTITQAQGNLIDAVFDFYAYPNNPRVPRGAFRMRGLYNVNTRQILFQGTQWINQPPGYGTVDLVGAVTPTNRDIVGIVTTPGCTDFGVTLQGR